MRGKGLTLAEVLVVLALLGGLGVLVVGAVVRDYSLKADAAEMASFLRSLQTEAVRREVALAVETRERGLRACEDTDLNGKCTAGEPVVRTYTPTTPGARVRVKVGAEDAETFLLSALGRPKEVTTLSLTAPNSVRTLCLYPGGAIGEDRGDGC